MKVRCIETEFPKSWIVGKVYEMTEELGITSEEGCLFETFLYHYGQGTLLKRWERFSDKTKFEEVKEMNKDDLKTGMVVELRDNTVFMVLIDKAINNNDHIEFKNFKDNLKSKCCSKFDIVKVYDIPKNLNRFKYLPDGCELLWERKEKSAAELELESIQAEMNKLTERMEQLKKEV